MRKQHDRGIIDFIQIVKHYFHRMNKWISEMDDPRHQGYITYSQETLIFMGIMKNVCSIKSMHQMDDFFNEEQCIRALSVLANDDRLEEMPHCDTLNYYLSKLSPECLKKLRTNMIKTLIRSKNFNQARLLNKYWRIILDGTGLFHFHERHCPNCLKTKIKGEDGKMKTIYYHKVLEAKLVLGEGFVVSVGTEFIENENEDVSKQDCELNAAKRLLPRIKKEYPKLPVILQADALYEAEPIMELCRKELKWRYLLTHKDTRQQNIGRDYELLTDEDKDIVKAICQEKGTGKYYNGMEKITGKKETMNLFEYEYETYENGQKKNIEFMWSTDLKITRKNLEELIKAGRGRWQIENQGFNVQKNILYHIQHLNSHNPIAMKNHYLLTQISDILMQLYIRGNEMVKKYGQGIKNTSSRLLESFRRHLVSDEDVSYIKRRTSVYLE